MRENSEDKKAFVYVFHSVTISCVSLLHGPMGSLYGFVNS